MTELRYYPWGDARYNVGSQVTKYQFTGHAWDGGTGLYFYGARWYDPSIGRFLSADTLVPSPGDPQSLNRYAYVLNNPLRHRDSSGHIPIDYLLDIGGILFDLYQMHRDPSPENQQALVLDMVCGPHLTYRQWRASPYIAARPLRSLPVMLMRRWMQHGWLAIWETVRTPC